MRHAQTASTLPQSHRRITLTTARRTEVSSIMTRNVVTARRGDTLDALVSILVVTGFSAVPVVDDRQRPIGIVTMIEALRASRPRSANDGPEALDFLPTRPTTASDIMASFVPTMPEHASVSDAAAAMAQLGIDWLVLVDPRRIVNGIVTTLDIARWVALHAGRLVVE